ncbi:MAG TPA: PilZ domain-containing protein [Vicinamibacterales bacterium]|nr:PilZ domain-containing protein [Vicinamibacterales bacterium]
MNRRIGERRLKPRFEVVGGELWGRFETVASLVVRNVGLHGALVHGRLALPPGSTQVLTTEVGGQAEQVRVRVTRCEPAAGPGGGYEIGLEFLTLSEHMRRFVEGWIAAGGAPEATA